MQKNLIKQAICGLLVAGLLTGCSSMNKNKHKSKASYGDRGQHYAARTHGFGEDNRSFAGSDFGMQSNQMMANRTFRFGFDRYDIAPEDYDTLQAHAEYLKRNPDAQIRVEGHTDQRGSREYNVGLGERRAKSVTNYMVSNGVSPSQINVVSYGQEKPEAFDLDEDSYRLNRRAVIVYE